jgi:hypothetical protein
MGVNRPLVGVLFFYEVFRLLFLVVFLLAARQESFAGGALSVYLSSNALFPLMALFVWLKPDEYESFLILYISGKVITFVSFFVWLFFSFRDFLALERTQENITILGSCFLFGMADIVSMCTAFAIKLRYRRALIQPLGGYLNETAGSGNRTEDGGV